MRFRRRSRPTPEVVVVPQVPATVEELRALFPARRRRDRHRRVIIVQPQPEETPWPPTES